MPRSRADEGVGRPAAWSGVGSTMLAAGVQHRVRQPTRHNNAPHWTRDGANLAASGQSGEAVSRGGYDQHARLGAASNLVARRAAPGSSLPVQTRGRRSMTVDEAQRARTRGEERAVVRARCGVEVPPTRAATTKERKKGGRGSGSLACVPACLPNKLQRRVNDLGPPAQLCALLARHAVQLCSLATSSRRYYECHEIGQRPVPRPGAQCHACPPPSYRIRLVFLSD